jgi:hypothetical protein
LVLTYGKRFASYTGHEMDIGRVRDEGGGRSVVFSVVKLPNGQPPARRLDLRLGRRRLQDLGR